MTLSCEGCKWLYIDYGQSQQICNLQKVCSRSNLDRWEPKDPPKPALPEKYELEVADCVHHETNTHSLLRKINALIDYLASKPWER